VCFVRYVFNQRVVKHFSIMSMRSGISLHFHGALTTTTAKIIIMVIVIIIIDNNNDLEFLQWFINN